MSNLEARWYVTLRHIQIKEVEINDNHEKKIHKKVNNKVHPMWVTSLGFAQCGVASFINL